MPPFPFSTLLEDTSEENENDQGTRHHPLPPEAVLVDWAGDKLKVLNGNSGEPWELEQFVAILGASHSPTWRRGKARMRGTGSEPTRGRFVISEGQLRRSSPITPPPQ